jgi:hypothetical protein
VLPQTLVTPYAPKDEFIIEIADMIKRRRVAKIKAKGLYRDPVDSSKSRFVKASGLRWLRSRSCSMSLGLAEYAAVPPGK